MRQWISSTLKAENFLLLEARSRTEVLDFATTHSRAIQVLLAQDHLVDDALVDLLARLRPSMQVVIIQDEYGQRGLSVAGALDTVRHFLQPIQ